MKNKTISIAITGGIASGKSTVGKIIRKYGFQVVSADRIGHDLLNEPQICEKLINIFGSEILRNKKIDRKKLGKLVFAERSQLKKLNSILHLEIRKKMQELRQNSREKFLFFEIPLLFENQLEKSYDLIINIQSREKNQLKRILDRDCISIDEAKNRISSQMSASEKTKKADITIVNDGDVNKLEKKTKEILYFFLKRAENSNSEEGIDN